MNTQLAIERNLRTTWSTGLSRFSQLIICRGRIRMIADKDTGKVYTELYGTGVYLHLYWFCDEIPPTIRNGEMATVIGNVQTYNLDSHVCVNNCLHVPRYGATLGKYLRAMIATYVLKPKTYVPVESIDKLGNRIFEARKKRITDRTKARKALTSK